MAQNTGWNKWMSDCLRHALLNNQYSKHCFKTSHTYSEYSLYPYRKNFSNPYWENAIRYIDVVGKEKVEDTIKSSVVIEIKSCWSDFTSGHGLNFFGNWNFIAVDCSNSNGFANQLLEYLNNHKEYEQIGLLFVTENGSVTTKKPAIAVWEDCYLNWIKALYVENHWEDYPEQNEISDARFYKITGHLLENDDNNKPYPIEELKITEHEDKTHYYNCSKYLRNDILHFEKPRYLQRLKTKS